MAIYKNGIIQAMGAEPISKEEINLSNLEPGIHYYDATDDGGFEPMIGNNYNHWTIISSYRMTLGDERAMTQIWLPTGSDAEPTGKYFFVRSQNGSNSWGDFVRYSSGDKLISLKDHKDNTAVLVDNTDPLNPKIKHDITKADKVKGATAGHLAALDSDGNLVDSDRNLDWLEYFTCEAVDFYTLELLFDTEEDNATGQGFTFATFGPSNIRYFIFDRNLKQVPADSITITSVKDLKIAENSLEFVRYTTAQNQILGIPANALVWQGAKKDEKNKSIVKVGAIEIEFDIKFTVDAIQYTKHKKAIVTGLYGRHIVWTEIQPGSRKFKIENNYVDPHGGKDPVFYETGYIDTVIADQMSPAGTALNIMAYTGIEGKFGELVRTQMIADLSANRSHLKIPTEKAIADYVDDQLLDKGIASIEYFDDTHKIRVLKTNGEELETQIPLASETVDGIMSKDDKQALNNMLGMIATVTGTAKISGNFGANPNQASLNKAWSDNASPKDIPPTAGCEIINFDQDPPVGHRWTYLQTGKNSDGTPIMQWIDRGTGDVSTATNTSLGVVKGVAPDIGYQYACDMLTQNVAAYGYEAKPLKSTTDPTFTIYIDSIDGAGNIKTYHMTPTSGANYKMYNGITFKNNDVLPTPNARCKTAFSSSIVGETVYVPMTDMTNPVLALGWYVADKNNVYARVAARNSNMYTLLISETPYLEVNFDILSWEGGPAEGWNRVNSDGEMYTNGYAALSDTVQRMRINKLDKKGLTIRSLDSYITVQGESPNYAIGMNVTGAQKIVNLTTLLDGKTSQWDLNDYSTLTDIDAVLTGADHLWFYGDGILWPGKDVTYNTSTGVLTCLNTPVWNPEENKTLYCVVKKTDLISLSGALTNLISSDGSVYINKAGTIADLTVNDNQIFNQEIQKFTPVPGTSMVYEGSLNQILQGLINNVRYLLDMAVIKYNTSDKIVKMAIQDDPVTPDPNYNIIKIKPSDLGQY